jgi:hypothetical protein
MLPPRIFRHPVSLIAAGVGLAILITFAIASRPRAESLPAVPAELEATRAALEKYQDPIAAVRDGCLLTLGCVEYSAGAMGIHFINPALVGPTPDPQKPTLLLYMPEGDRLRLIGAEWFVPLATGITERPQLFGRPFDGPMEGHEPLMPKALHHYDLHVWLWQANPARLFAYANPDLRCPRGAYSFLDQMPAMVAHGH